MGDINDDNDDNVLIDNFDDMSYEMPQTEFEVINSTQLINVEHRKNIIQMIILFVIIGMLFLAPIAIGIALLVINSDKFLLLGILLIVIPIAIFLTASKCVKR